MASATAEKALSVDLPEVESISCHAFSRADKLLAVCPGDERVLVFKLSDREYRYAATLSKHTQRVTGLHWSCHDRLVSVSEDRTAFVWTWDAAATEFKCGSVELNSPRAALCVMWSPDGERFAVGLSSKEVSICHYEESVNCWNSKRLGRPKTSQGAMTTVAWHPRMGFLVTGSTDRRCIVYDVHHNGADFGAEVFAEDVNAWVNAVAFSTSGSSLAMAVQDSTLRFKDMLKSQETPWQVVVWRQLPFLQMVFVDDSCLVACGFDCKPVVFRRSGQWALSQVIEAGAAVPKPMQSEKRESYVQSQERFGSGAAANKSSGGHVNSITCCTLLEGGRFATSSPDGVLVIWTLPSA